MVRVLAALSFSVALFASALAQDKPAPASPPAAQGQGDPKLGGLSEEEFAKLHSLKADDATPTKGTMVDLADGSKAYLSLPEGWKEGGPALVVIHEFWGLNSHIKLWCDRLTETGRAALAVDLYEGKVTKDRKEAAQLMRAVDDKKAIPTLLAGHKFLKDDPRVKAGKRGSIGWCMGGAMSLKLAIAAPDLDACVMYYGPLINDANQLKNIKAPLLGIFAKRDQQIPPEAVEVFDKKLTEAGVEHKIHLFEADHAFANPSGQRYDKASASAAWGLVKTFFDEKLPAKSAAN